MGVLYVRDPVIKTILYQPLIEWLIKFNDRMEMFL